MPEFNGMRFATAVVEHCKRRETGVEEAIIEMYLAGVFTRRIEDVNEIPRSAGVSAGAVSNLDGKGFKAVEEWTCRPLACEYPYVCVDEIYLKRSWGASCDNAACMVGSIAEVFPDARYQHCTVHFYRNALAKVPKSKRPQQAIWNP